MAVTAEAKPPPGRATSVELLTAFFQKHPIDIFHFCGPREAGKHLLTVTRHGNTLLVHRQGKNQPWLKTTPNWSLAEGSTGNPKETLEVTKRALQALMTDLHILLPGLALAANLPEKKILAAVAGPLGTLSGSVVAPEIPELNWVSPHWSHFVDTSLMLGLGKKMRDGFRSWRNVYHDALQASTRPTLGNGMDF